MGNRTIIQLVNVKIKKESMPLIARALRSKKGGVPANIQRFLDVMTMDDEGILHLNRVAFNFSSYGVPEDDVTSDRQSGVWYFIGDLAAWLKSHCEMGGRIIEHSEDSSGTAWGWEFDGKGGVSYFKIDHADRRKR